MNRTGKRRYVRLDYKVLHTTGEKVEKEESSGDLHSVSTLHSTMSNSEDGAGVGEEVPKKVLDQLSIQEAALSEDILDYLEENPVADIQDLVQDLDVAISKVEGIRTTYRGKHIELCSFMGEQYDAKFAKPYGEMMIKVKNYILHAKKIRKMIRDSELLEKKEEKLTKGNSFKFLLKEGKRLVTNLESTLERTHDDVSDGEVIKRKEELPQIKKNLEEVSFKFPQMMRYAAYGTDEEDEIEDLQKRYDILISMKNDYCSRLQIEADTRELEKQSKFDEGRLNIKLPKFKGYASSIDVFTFKSDFEKLHLRRTPRELLPDLLKNNFLEESALVMVKNLDDIDEIWKRLKEAFGDPKVMMNRKFAELSPAEPLLRSRDPEKVSTGLGKVINIMKDLESLTKQHKIEKRLYYGDGMQQIYRVVGEIRITRWISENCDKNLDEESSWESLQKFLEKELRIQHQRQMILGKSEASQEKNQFKQEDRDSRKDRFDGRQIKKFGHYAGGAKSYKEDSKKDDSKTNKDGRLLCHFCGEAGHVATVGPGYKQIIQYFACRRFAEMTPDERFKELWMKGLCFQCLYPGASSNDGKHKEGNCQRDFVCKHPSHQRYPRRKHVLVCNEHRSNQENEDLLQEYKSRCILKEKMVELPSFTKDIKLSFLAESLVEVKKDTCYSSQTVAEKAIYQLQIIKVGDQRFLIFFDSGCSDFVSTVKAVKRMGSKAVQECPGPIQLGGVGGVTTESPHGIYRVNLPMFDGEEVQLSGACLEQITTAFPEYPIKGKVEDDIHEAFIQQGGKPEQLPRLPRHVGGEIDFMIGVKYLRYHPEKVFQLPSGLTIYRSVFENADGGRGIIGGPHEVFTDINSYYNLNHNLQLTFFNNQQELYRKGYQVNPDVSILGLKYPQDGLRELLPGWNGEDGIVGDGFLSQSLKMFDAAEKCGSEITYRCISCRACKNCKDHDQIEAVSIREEVEEDLIKNAVKVDIKERICTASLPFIHDPVVKLAPNRHKALKVYNQQLKKMNNAPNDKVEVLKSEKKLQSLGYVDYVRNLSPEQQLMLQRNPIKNFIPWRVVWKDSSVSTPCRIVFDASQSTDTGFSLNDVLAKGRNNMNKLQEIVIRWGMHHVGLHTDIQKMYNCVRLKEPDWCFQRYIWQEELDAKKIPEEKVIKTLIYGVRSSGNLSERSIRETANLSTDEYPQINELVCKDIYVDDCISGAPSERSAASTADQLEIVLNRGGFSLKGIAYSGKDPPESLSDDGVSVVVAGVRWFSKEDKISLNMGKLIFAKKQRGRKVGATSVIPEKLTRRHCVSKVAEIFDITGKITPITAGMKLDLHELVRRKLDWDDVIPDDLRALWGSHFEMMQEINCLRYKRAIIPEDATSLHINTIDFGDASSSIACVAIYARFQRRSGGYSCQLVISRSRLIPEGMSQPRAELFAAVLNTHSGEVVRKAFYKHHQKSYKLTDSQITLHWISNEERPLKQWVRNRVIEIRRFTNSKDWSYINSKNMIADKGTRKGCTLKEVDQNSEWINGFEWVRKDCSQFPVKSVQEISFNQNELQEVKKEMSFSHDYDQIGDVRKMVHNCVVISRNLPDEVIKRYEFSQYIIDPNKRRFHTVIRITAWVMKFIQILQNKVKKSHQNVQDSSSEASACLSDDDIKKAENYFFKAATREVKHFMKEKQYMKFSEEKDGILIYTGRILPDEVCAATPMTSAMKDLASTTFCVPVVDKFSPIAYSIVNEIHWHDKTVKHSGIETMWRYVLKKAFIVEGRELVKKMKKSCQRCRYLAKRTIEVAMGPVSTYNMTIAPCFYISQVDLCGPFKAFSYHNKRATLKIWLVVFVCVTTSTTSIKVMEDYSSTAFIQSFIRFSCEVGYPKILLADSGSQIVKSVDTMKLNFRDIQMKLHQDVGVEFELCPVGGHNINGKVERMIRKIKTSLEKSVSNERLSVLQWETVAAEVANSINDLPLALGNTTSDFESMDLITPNRLRLGRNNDRSPVGSMCVTNNPSSILESNLRIFNAWFENWLISHVPKLVNQPKWFKTDEHLQEGDIVLFLKNESILSSTYQYGVVNSVTVGKDGKIRKATIRYRNHNEDFDRETNRSVRQLVIIHRVNELDILQELGELANFADYKFKLNGENLNSTNLS